MDNIGFFSDSLGNANAENINFTPSGLYPPMANCYNHFTPSGLFISHIDFQSNQYTLVESCNATFEVEFNAGSHANS